MAYRKYRPSKKVARDFAIKMKEIESFCDENGIIQSANSDSYYFTLNGQKYRVSNHSVEASNSKAYNWCGEQVRDKYHPNGRESDVFYIHASKTRIIEIYNNIKTGFTVDHRGYIKH